MTGVAILKMETTGAAILRASNSSATILQGVEGVGPPGPPGSGGGAPTDASYVVLSLDGDLTDERVLTAGTGITLTDGGAGSTVTVAVDRDTDGTLAANSDSKIATQKATKTYADGKIPKSTVTAKGDLIAATGSAVVTNVAVGTNGKALKADSTQTAGVGWDYAVPPAGDPKAGSTTYYCQPGFVPTTVTSQSLSAGSRYFYQFWLPTAATCDQIAIEQTTAAAAGKLFRIGLIAADKWWQPTGSVLIESGTFAADGANGVKTYTPGSPVLLPAGNYLGVVHSDGAPAIRVSAGGLGTGAGYPTGLGAATLGFFAKSMALAAIDNTAWDVVSGIIAAMRNGVWLRFSDPAS